jgi:pilus assembly protein Flp/PilA
VCCAVEKGQGMVEYGLIIGLIAVRLIGAITALSGGLSGIFGKITGELQSATATS